MPHRRIRHPHGARAIQLALAVVGGLAIITSPGCGGGGWSNSLFGASRTGSIQSVERYLEQGESVNTARAQDGRTPLHIAVERGHRKMVTFLLNNGAFVNPRDHEGNTPLHLAAAAGHDSIVRILLSAHADATIRNNDGRKPLDLARDHPEVSKDLRNAGG